MSHRIHLADSRSGWPTSRGRLRRWSPVGFLSGAVVVGVIWHVNLGVLDPLADLAVTVGLFLAVCAGLLGYALWVTEWAPRFGALGLVATVAATLAVAAPAVWTVVAVLTGTPAGVARPDWRVTAYQVAAVATGLAFLAYGVGTVRQRNRALGLLVVVAALAWVGALHSFLLGSCDPVLIWSGRVVFPLTMFVLGAALVVEAALLDADPAEWVVSPGSAGTDGWTNEQVEEGFDVDGSVSRQSLLGRTAHLASEALWYELSGRFRDVFIHPNRYDNRRWVGELLGRRAAIEQEIAEAEYVITAVTGADRDGVGSPRWRIAVVTFAVWVVGLLLLLYGGILALFGALLGELVALVVGVTIGATALVTFLTDWRIYQRLGERMSEAL